MNNKGTDLLKTLLIEDISWFDVSQDYMRYLQYAPLFLLFFVIVLLTTPVVGKIAQTLDVMSDTKKMSKNRLNKYENNERRVNPNRVPLLGGIAVILPIVIAIPLFLGFNLVTGTILASLLVILIFATIDDAFNLPGTAQFLIQFCVALIVVLLIHDLHSIKVPFDGFIDVNLSNWQSTLFGQKLSFIFPGDLITIFWIMVCMNAVKWMNGLDALMESNMIVAYVLLFIIGVRNEALFVIIISSMLVGGLSAFTIFNLPPAKIFSSATGSLSYGFLIATLSLLNQTKFAITIIILMIPLVDFVFVLFKRLFIYKPKGLKAIVLTPIQLMRMSDTNHLHHQLLKLNLSNQQIVMIEVLLTLVIGSLAVLTAEAYRLFIIFSIGIILLFALLLVHLLTHRKKIRELEISKSKETPESKYSY